MNLIHIGLPKTASTSLQSQWSIRSDINYAADNLLPLIENTRRAIKLGTDPNELLQYWPQVSSTHDVTIFSSEGLSGMPWGNHITLEMHDFGHYLFANLCREKVKDAQILIFVRSPIDWIRSVYLQMIQEGHTFGFKCFIRHQRNYLSSALNLSAITHHWSEAYGDKNVIIYPFEKLVQSPIQANQEISRALGVSESLNLFKLGQKSNTSLNTENIQLLRALSILNRRIKGKKSNLEHSFKKLNEEMRLLYRVQLQQSPKEFSFLKNLLAPLNTSLPPTEKAYFKTLLTEHFLNEIKKQGDKYQIHDLYQTQINQYLDGVSA